MKNSEIKALTAVELAERLKAELDSMGKLKFAQAISPIENPMKIRVSRKLIARLKTELRSKELAN
jgi:large subunit ribosomal protein L29